MKRATVTLVAFMAVVSICAAATNVNSVNVVGYKKVETTANVYKIMGVNFEKIASTNFVFTISDLLATNGLPNLATVYLFNGLTYVPEQFYEGFGWWPDTNKIYRGDAFWFISTANLTNAFLGEVPCSDYAGTTSIPLSQGCQLFTYPYPVSILADDTALHSHPYAVQGDAIYVFNASGTYDAWVYYDGYGFYCDAYPADQLTLEPGVGYWYSKIGAGTVTWIEPKPYLEP